MPKCSASRIETEKTVDASNRKMNVRIKTPEAIDKMRLACRLPADLLDMIEPHVQPGVTTEELDRICHDYIVDHQGAIPAPLDYRGFPKSICTSVNEVICHGIPGDRILKDGDIVNIDVTSILNGYYADANKTFFVGTPGDDARKIVGVARECLNRAMRMIAPGNTVGDIGWAIQTFAESEGCSVVREFVGHGVGFDFHEAPQIPHYGRRGEGIVLIPGMVFTVEPMINLGRKELRILKDQWTAVTRDGSLSAQFEQTFLVTETGVESLTPFDLSAAI